MKPRLRTIWLVGGLCLASSLLAAQNQAIGPEREMSADVVERINQLQKWVARLNAELASARQHLRDSSTPETRAAISQKVADLQKEVGRLEVELYSTRVELLRVQLDSIRLEMRNIPAAKAAGHQSSNEGNVIQTLRLKDLAVNLTNDQGPFTKGQNSFCIEFKNVREGSMADAGQVRVDFTNAIGRVKVVRAIAHVTPAEVGRYCGQVNLPMPGAWLVTAKYDGPSGKGKARFTPTVK